LTSVKANAVLNHKLKSLKSFYDEDVINLGKVRNLMDENIRQQQKIEMTIQNCKQNHQVSVKRVDKLLTIMNMLQTKLSKAEVDYHNELKKMELEFPNYQKKVYHLNDMSEKVEPPPIQTDFQMTPARIKKVESILVDQHEAIKKTIDDIKTLTKQLEKQN